MSRVDPRTLEQWRYDKTRNVVWKLNVAACSGVQYGTEKLLGRAQTSYKTLRTWGVGKWRGVSLAIQGRDISDMHDGANFFGFLRCYADMIKQRCCKAASILGECIDWLLQKSCREAFSCYAEPHLPAGQGSVTTRELGQLLRALGKVWTFLRVFVGGCVPREVIFVLYPLFHSWRPLLHLNVTLKGLFILNIWQVLINILQKMTLQAYPICLLSILGSVSVVTIFLPHRILHFLLLCNWSGARSGERPPGLPRAHWNRTTDLRAQK